MPQKRVETKARTVLHGVSVYDGTTEELIEFIEIRGFDHAQFKKQFDVSELHDPLMHDRYAIGPDDAPFVKQALQQKIEFDFKTRAYFIEAVEAR